MSLVFRDRNTLRVGSSIGDSNVKASVRRGRPCGLRTLASIPGRKCDPPGSIAATKGALSWRASATIMYMYETVGVAELRQNLSRFLERVARGERLLVTDHNRPVAELGPPPVQGPSLDRLIASGRVSAPVRPTIPEPIEMTGDPYALSRALEQIRSER